MLFAAVQKFGERGLSEVPHQVERVVLTSKQLQVSDHLNLRSAADACTKCNVIPAISESVVVVKGKKYHEHHIPKS